MKEAFVHADETGWREAGHNGYVWCLATERAAAVRYDEHDQRRSRAVVSRLVGKTFEGHLVSDFYGAYNVYHLSAEVPADNNLAERTLRPLVVQRKVSGGSGSRAGTEARLGLASLFATWHARHRGPFHEFLGSPCSPHGCLPLKPLSVNVNSYFMTINFPLAHESAIIANSALPTAARAHPHTHNLHLPTHFITQRRCFHDD